MALNDPYECIPALTDTNHDELLDQAIKSTENENLMANIAKSGVERQAILEELKKAKETLKEEYKKSNRVEEMFMESYWRNVNTRVGILCLSKRKDSSLMWSHYTDGRQRSVLGVVF